MKHGYEKPENETREDATKVRAPYEAPRIEDSTEFETLALSTCLGASCTVMSPTAST